MQKVLIEKVRQYEFLYNVRLPDYRDQNMRYNAWEAIGSELKITGKEARNMWTKLRNCYSNALKRRHCNNSGQASTNSVPWKYEKQMAFLQPSLYARSTRSNLSQPKESPQSEEPPEIFEEEPNIVDEKCFEIEVTQPNISPPTLISEETPHSKRKIILSNPTDEIVQRRNAEMRMEISQNNTSDLDEIDMFYLSMAKTVKRLPALDQVHIRLELCKLVSEAEIRQIQLQNQI